MKPALYAMMLAALASAASAGPHRHHHKQSPHFAAAPIPPQGAFEQLATGEWSAIRDESGRIVALVRVGDAEAIVRRLNGNGPVMLLPAPALREVPQGRFPAGRPREPGPGEKGP